MGRKNNPNPHNLKKGDKVMFSLRKDGIPHRDGNDAVWELLEDPTDIGLTYLHLVGADKSRTAGAAASSLRPVK
jgi:hypothetical protein